MSDGSEYVSNHDRGAFGKLLAEAKALGTDVVRWECRLHAPPDDEERWFAEADPANVHQGTVVSRGRTGEEALRRLVEKLRIAREGKST